MDEQNILSGQFWGELRVFLAVAKARSFNRAGAMLGMSHLTVSRQVKRLQDIMGTQLVVPTKHGVIFTEKGESLAQSVRKLDQELFALSSGIKSKAGEIEGVVRVSITDALGSIFLAPSLENFSQIHPRIQVHIKSPFNMSDLLQNQSDMMVGFKSAESSELCFQPLGNLHFVPVASQSYIRDHGLPTHENIEDHRFIQSEYYAASTGLWGRWLALCERGSITHYCDHPFAYGMLVKSGLGIGLLASYTVLERSAVPLNLDARISAPMFLIAVRQRLQARPVRVVFDWISTIFGPQNPWFAERLRLDAAASSFDAGFRRLFNIDH